MVDAIDFINENISKISEPIKVDGYADPVGEAPYNKILSEKRARSVANYMKNNGVQTDNFVVTGYGETTSYGSNRDNRRVEVTVTVNGPYDSSSLGGNEVTVQPVNTSLPVQAKATSTHDRHRFQLSLAALHTELASESSSGSSDEVLSEVRAAANLDYSYYFKPSFYLNLLGGIRWYEYEENTNVFIEEDQTNWSYRFGAGIGYKILDWWDVNLTATYDSQLYYFVNSPSGLPEITFDLEGGVRGDLTNTIRFIDKKSWDFKTGVAVGYLTGSDRIESGYSYSVKPSIGIMRKKSIDLYALYQVNDFEVESFDIKHEILELGVSLDF